MFEEALPVRYLMVDDEPLTRASLAKRIEDLKIGFRLAGEASDGDEALDLLGRVGADVVLSDIRMPGADGLALAKEASLRFPHVRVVLVSAHQDFDYARRALGFGVKDYLLKPVRPEQLRTTLTEISAELASEERRELEHRLAVLEGRRGDLFEEWGRLLLADNVRRAENLLRRLADEAIRAYPHRPRLSVRLLGALCGRLIERSRLDVEVPFGPGRLPADDARDPAGVRAALYGWLVEVRNRLRERGGAQGRQVAEEIKRYVEEHYGEPFSLEDVAEALHFNKTYLAGLFKEETGTTIGRYAQEVRLKKAGEILRTERPKTYEVAARVGYRDVAHFTKAFKERYGVSPKVYRNTIRRGGEKTGGA